MDKLIAPHGGYLNPLKEESESLGFSIDKEKELNSIVLDSMELSDVNMLSSGAFSPLEGFMNQEDYKNVVADMRLKNGVLWPIPVTLSVSKEKAASIRGGEAVALHDKYQNLAAILHVEDIYEVDSEQEAHLVYKTIEDKHPGVARLNSIGSMRIGGKVQVVNEGNWGEEFPEYATPSETRQIFAEKGWKTITAFQTRNPLHRSHEYLTKLSTLR